MQQNSSTMPHRFDVTIVIPTYGEPEFCCEAIDSCLKSDTHSVEVLVIDDGAEVRADETIRTRFPDLFNRIHGKAPSSVKTIRYIFHENQGAYLSRLYGAKQARGEFLKFLDHDDLLCEGALDAEITFARIRNTDVLMSDWEETWINGDQSEKMRKHIAPEYVDPLLDFIRKGGVYTSAALYRTQLFANIEPVSGWRPRLSDDWVIFGQVLFDGADYSTLHRNSYQWRHHERQLSKATPVGHTREFYHFLSWMEDALHSKNLLTPERSLALASYYTKNAVLLGYCDPDWWHQIAKRTTELDPTVTLSTGNALVRILVWILGLERGILAYTGLRKQLRPFPFDQSEELYSMWSIITQITPNEFN